MKKQAATNRPAKANTNRVTSTRQASGMKQAAGTSTANRTTPATTRGQATAKKQAPGRASTRAPAKPAGSEATGGKQQKAQREAAPSLKLKPIGARQSRSQIIATVAADSGVERPIVERVARALSQTLTRHLIRDGSGRVEIPYLGGALWRGQQAARKARTMFSPILKREVQIPSKRAQSTARFQPHSVLRELVARS